MDNKVYYKWVSIFTIHTTFGTLFFVTVGYILIIKMVRNNTSVFKQGGKKLSSYYLLVL